MPVDSPAVAVRFLTPREAPAQVAQRNYPDRSGGSHQAIGKGWTRAEAEASAIGEAVERSSAFHRTSDEVIHASLRRIDDSALHPNRVMQFSESQLASEQNRAEALEAGLDIIPDSLPQDLSIPWTRLSGVRGEQQKCIPAGCVYFSFADPSAAYCRADSVGLAAGESLESALFAGLLECVERDAVAIWWYNRLTVRRVAPESFNSGRLDNLREYLRRYSRDWWLLDLTTDLGIPVMASVSPAPQPGRPMLWGFGAAPTVQEAANRAAVEMCQGLPLLASDWMAPRLPDRADMRFLTSEAVDEMSYLLGTPFPGTRHVHPRERDLSAIASHLAEHDLECYYVDLTRPDLDLSVAKTFVPGLRHPAPRFAPGRLYEVPVRLGYQEQPTTEQAMNPLPFIL